LSQRDGRRAILYRSSRYVLVQAPDSRIASSSSTPHARQHAFETMVSVFERFEISALLLLPACWRACEGRKLGRSVGLSVLCECRHAILSHLLLRLHVSLIGRRKAHWLLQDECTCIADGSSAARTNRERNDVGVHPTI
jgi:hypothetical protein